MGRRYDSLRNHSRFDDRAAFTVKLLQLATYDTSSLDTYEHLFTFSNYRYFQSLTEKEGDSSLFRLATLDLLVLKNVRFFAKRYRTKYTVDFADS